MLFSTARCSWLTVNAAYLCDKQEKCPKHPFSVSAVKMVAEPYYYPALVVARQMEGGLLRLEGNINSVLMDG